MITSSLGLAEVPRVPAPMELRTRHPDIRFIVPHAGATLPVIADRVAGFSLILADVDPEADVMRGEETLCAGLLMLGIISPAVTVLSLGSHWKAIQLDAAGHIASSSTTLSGEMIHFTQTQTILASAVPQERPVRIDARWLEAGMSQQRKCGLARALFGVRLLEQSKQGSPEERLSFLVGVFVASDVDAWQRAGLLSSSVAIVGSGGLVDAWRQSLDALRIQVQVITDIESEQAILRALRFVASSHEARRSRSQIAGSRRIAIQGEHDDEQAAQPVFLRRVCCCGHVYRAPEQSTGAGASARQPRARDLGVPFEGTSGPLNAITDVKGVEVGIPQSSQVRNSKSALVLCARE
jgi:2-keto-3-deoxy-galactonokinase